VAGVPREFLDGMAEFAAGIRNWAEWRSWFAGRAARLVRVADRGLFEQLKRDPEAGVAAFLRHEGVTIRPPEPRHPGRPDDEVAAAEYEVYTALCRQLDLFLFDRPDTVFEDHTDRDSFCTPASRPSLAFDEACREYQVVVPEFAERFAFPFRRWFDRCPEMADQYESRNQRRWPLEDRFEVANGYRFVSASGDQEWDLVRGAFCLSRVGFSADCRFALVFLRCDVACSYYLVFEREPTRWERAESYMAWVT
jgi:hypothetical protein